MLRIRRTWGGIFEWYCATLHRQGGFGARPRQRKPSPGSGGGCTPSLKLSGGKGRSTQNRSIVMQGTSHPAWHSQADFTLPTGQDFTLAKLGFHPPQRGGFHCNSLVAYATGELPLARELFVVFAPSLDGLRAVQLFQHHNAGQMVGERHGPHGELEVGPLFDPGGHAE